MMEVVSYIPEIAITLGTAIVVFSVKRYISNQDKRYEGIAGELKVFSSKFLEVIDGLKDSIHIFKMDNVIHHETCTGRHDSAVKTLERHEEDIEALYNRSNEHNTKIAKIEEKLIK